MSSVYAFASHNITATLRFEQASVHVVLLFVFAIAVVTVVSYINSTKDMTEKKSEEEGRQEEEDG